MEYQDQNTEVCESLSMNYGFVRLRNYVHIPLKDAFINTHVCGISY